jgi:2-keto-3-deoxy-L-rhamnonate aldolase RhmA
MNNSAVILRSAKRRLEGRSTRMQPECAGERRVDRRGGSVICSIQAIGRGSSDMKVRNPARERLERGELSVGVGVRAARTVDIAKMMKSCGYDWLFIDLEHGTMSLEFASTIAVAALDTGIAPIVRVPFMQHHMATRALDGGALGIVMPHVDTPEQARDIADHLKYPPMGHRVGRGAPGDLRLQADEDRRADRRVERRDAGDGDARNADRDRQCRCDRGSAGDRLPADRDQRSGGRDGIPGEFGHERIVAAYEITVAACRKHGKWSGIGGVYTEDLLRKYVGMGVQMVLAGNDVGFLMAAGTQRAAQVREWGGNG